MSGGSGMTLYHVGWHNGAHRCYRMDDDRQKRVYVGCGHLMPRSAIDHARALSDKPSEVWCSKCDQPSIADFHFGNETVALCAFHAGTEAWPSQIAEMTRDHEGMPS